ncbi:PREDICTED: non-specific lipid transfer protein GPI-anchored 2-like isoform X3 [Lupinus angustifolius]|uniref:non-specific lipid transfer protein GPI-anchored 2-like isoform X3 n=1 Tax=Lupinus angustifolius TaxID=3871 RepID=UPI00092E3F36|nr:PREDICTED: non-specific lipid transfer protein GPI-anchored 2-like isoform X3 [Lupinus angustifolius]
MAHRRMGLVLVALAMLLKGGAGQSSCVTTLISLSPCLNYISGNSSTPSSGCCSQLASVVRSSPQCLCQVLNGGGSSLGININQTQALALPGACNVQTPPTSQCNGTVVDTPAESPNSIPSGTGSKTVPTTQNGSSNGNSIKLSIPLFLILAATYASAFTTY